MVHTAPSEHLSRLTSREEFERFVRRARSRWSDLWEGNKTVVSVGVDAWGVDFGLLDATGALLGNPVHHRDSRTDGVAERLEMVVALLEDEAAVLAQRLAGG